MNNKRPRRSISLRLRLVLTISLILCLCQAISVAWLWHESAEQIELIVEETLKHRDMRQHIEKEIHEAVASLALPSAVMIVLALLLCFQAVKWLTRPITELQKELEARGENNISPVEYRSAVPEIDAMIQAMNQLLTRINDSLERERLFTADVAHELRTPLAGLRLHLELIERAHQVDVQPLIARLDHMTNSVSQLLHLARVGQSFSAGQFQYVALINDVVLPMQAEMRSMLSLRGQALRIKASQDVTMRGDATLIRMLLRNLVENASRYSPEHTTIIVTVASWAGATLTVEDEGPGIDAARSGELSRAFVRMDSRYGGIGLGLSIVTRIVQLHKGHFFLENRTPPPGCRARVNFEMVP